MRFDDHRVFFIAESSRDDDDRERYAESAAFLRFCVYVRISCLAAAAAFSLDQRSRRDLSLSLSLSLSCPFGGTKVCVR